MRIVDLSALLFSSLVVAACASSEHVIVGGDGGAGPEQSASPTNPAVGDVAAFCTAMCNRELACDKALDTQTCTNTCTNTNAAIFPRLRADVVGLIVACFDSKDCKTVLQSSFVGACTADAIASVAPSAAAATFCDALATAKKSCTGASAQTKAECLNTAKLYGDPAIAQAQNCAKRSCTEMDTCVSAVFGSLTGGTKPTPTTTCDSALSDLSSCSACLQSSCCAEASACAADSGCNSAAHACLSNGTSTACSNTYSSLTTSSRSLAQTLFSCASSKCSSTCTVGG